MRERTKAHIRQYGHPAQRTLVPITVYARTPGDSHDNPAPFVAWWTHAGLEAIVPEDRKVARIANTCSNIGDIIVSHRGRPTSPAFLRARRLTTRTVARVFRTARRTFSNMNTYASAFGTPSDSLHR
jgi:hypothetical protein